MYCWPPAPLPVKSPLLYSIAYTLACRYRCCFILAANLPARGPLPLCPA